MTASTAKPAKPKKPVGTAPASHGNVALFLGDASVVDPLVHALVEERMGSSSRDLDFEIFRFGERPLSEVETALRQVGMFSPRRCIWLRGVEESRRKAASADDDDDGEDDGDEDDEHGEADDAAGTGELLALLEGGVPESTLFVVSAAALDARGRLFKWFANNARVEDRRVAVEQKGKKRGRLSDEGLRAAIEQRLREIGVRTIAAGAIDEIVRRSGKVLGETLQEVDRLVLAQRDPEKLSVADVRSGMRDLSTGWVFDLTDAIVKRDLAAAETLVAQLLAQGEPPLMMSALLASYVGRLVAARPFTDSLPRGWQRMKAADFLRGPGASLPESLRTWPGYFAMLGSAGFTPDELHRLHGELRRLDAALKSAPVSPLLLFSRLLQGVCIRPPRT